MRDDRFRGTELRQPVRKLFEMGSREADRNHPLRMRDQAVSALQAGSDNEVSTSFRKGLLARKLHRGLFDEADMQKSSRSRREAEIADALSRGKGVAAEKLVEQVYVREGDALIWELKQIYAMDHETVPREMIDSITTAFREASAQITNELFRPCLGEAEKPKMSLSDDLLGNSHPERNP